MAVKKVDRLKKMAHCPQGRLYRTMRRGRGPREDLNTLDMMCDCPRFPHTVFMWECRRCNQILFRPQHRCNSKGILVSDMMAVAKIGRKPHRKRRR